MCNELYQLPHALIDVLVTVTALPEILPTALTKWRPQASWLCQVESYLKDMGLAGLASAWAMARRSPVRRVCV